MLRLGYSTKIEKSEIKYAIIGAAILTLWFLYIQKAIAPYLQTLNPFLAFVVYQSGLFLGIYLLASVVSSKKIQLKLTIASISLLIGYDIWVAPYLVSGAGVIATNVEYWYVSSDVAMASLFSSFLPQGMVYIATYVVAPIILMFIVPIILAKPHEIKKMLIH